MSIDIQKLFGGPECVKKYHKKRGPKSSEDIANRDYWISELVIGLRKMGITHEQAREIVSWYYEYNIEFSKLMEIHKKHNVARNNAIKNLKDRKYKDLELSTSSVKRIYENYQKQSDIKIDKSLLNNVKKIDQEEIDISLHDLDCSLSLSEIEAAINTYKEINYEDTVRLKIKKK
jgi:hypothetical protein